MSEHLSPPRPFDDHDFAVHGSQAAVSDSDKPSGPADTTLPLPGAPDEDSGDDTAHQGYFFGHLNDPVDGAADAAAIFAGM